MRIRAHIITGECAAVTSLEIDVLRLRVAIAAIRSAGFFVTVAFFILQSHTIVGKRNAIRDFALVFRYRVTKPGARKWIISKNLLDLEADKSIDGGSLILSI